MKKDTEKSASRQDISKKIKSLPIGDKVILKSIQIVSGNGECLSTTEMAKRISTVTGISRFIARKYITKFRMKDIIYFPEKGRCELNGDFCFDYDFKLSLEYTESCKKIGLNWTVCDNFILNYILKRIEELKGLGFDLYYEGFTKISKECGCSRGTIKNFKKKINFITDKDFYLELSKEDKKDLNIPGIAYVKQFPTREEFEKCLQEKVCKL